MTVEELDRLIQEYDGVRRTEGYGDLFYLYDPDGDLPPERQQPFATIVTGTTTRRSRDSTSRAPGDSTSA